MILVVLFPGFCFLLLERWFERQGMLDDPRERELNELANEDREHGNGNAEINAAFEHVRGRWLSF